MSDRARRSAERAAHDDPHQALAALKARVREGELELWRVELAAYCQHAPALALLPDAVVGPTEPKAWVWGLARWGKDVVVRAGLLAADLCVWSEPAGESEALQQQARERADLLAWLDSEEPKPELTAFDLQTSLQAGSLEFLSPYLDVGLAIGLPLHGLDSDAVRWVADVVDRAQGNQQSETLLADLAAWALSPAAPTSP